MQIIYVFVVVFLLSSGVAVAQDNIIRVIDGKHGVQEIEVFPAFKVRAREAPVEEVSAPEVGVSEPAQMLEVEPEPEPEPAAVKTKAEVFIAIPLPGRKPAVPPARVGETVESLPAAPSMPQTSAPITKERAIAIAVEYAPPARGVTALPKMQEGRAVYVVEFKTEDGLVQIIVDRQSGEIIR